MAGGEAEESRPAHPGRPGAGSRLTMLGRRASDSGTIVATRIVWRLGPGDRLGSPTIGRPGRQAEPVRRRDTATRLRSPSHPTEKDLPSGYREPPIPILVTDGTHAEACQGWRTSAAWRLGFCARAPHSSHEHSLA